MRRILLIQILKLTLKKYIKFLNLKQLIAYLMLFNQKRRFELNIYFFNDIEWEKM